MKKWMNKLCSMVSLYHDERGAVLPLVGLSFIVVVLAAGFAIDYSRAHVVKERLQWALDAGALAGAKLAASGDRTAVEREANDYFRANFPAGYMDTQGGTVKASFIDAESGSGTGVRFTVSDMKMRNYFMSSFGFTQFNVAAASEVNALPLTPMDVIFAVDMSGSMNWRDGTGAECLWSGGRGGAYGDIMRTQTSENWCTCEDDCAGKGLSRLSRAKQHMRDLRARLDADGNRFGVVPWDNRVRMSDGSYRSGNGAANCKGDGAWTCNGHIARILAPTGDKTTFNDYVGGNTTGMQPWGNTDHANGMYWALRTMQDSNAPNRSIIFITDGWPTMNYTDHGAVFGADGVQQLALLNLFRTHCTQAKNAGIQVYTILYNVEETGDGRVKQVINALSNCASPGHFYPASDAARLANVFNAIGTHMMTMRLTK